MDSKFSHIPQLYRSEKYHTPWLQDTPKPTSIFQVVVKRFPIHHRGGHELLGSVVKSGKSGRKMDETWMFHGGTPISHPKCWSFLSGNPHGCWGTQHFRSCPHMIIKTTQWHIHVLAQPMANLFQLFGIPYLVGKISVSTFVSWSFGWLSVVYLPFDPAKCMGKESSLCCSPGAWLTFMESTGFPVGMGRTQHLYNLMENGKHKSNDVQQSTWFKVDLWSPSSKSLSPWKGHVFTVPKWSQKNCQDDHDVYVYWSTA